MLRYALRLPEKEFYLLDYPAKLTNYERKLSGEICDILTPLEDVTDRVQWDTMVTSTMAIICTRSQHEEVRSLRDTYNCKMVSTLQKSIETSLKKYACRWNDWNNPPPPPNLHRSVAVWWASWNLVQINPACGEETRSVNTWHSVTSHMTPNHSFTGETIGIDFHSWQNLSA